MLRRLDDAIADGQPIYAVVRSSVANHDGRSNGITAPSRRSQVRLMRRALELAEVEAGQIDFVEAHGTGTILGDMIEVNALGDVHQTRAGALCVLGSVKGNIGHTEGSAGIAGFIKACLALHHRVLPPTVFGESANPRLRLEAQGLRLAEGPQELPADVAVGAVSSFGLGGSNAHVVLESAPAAMTRSGCDRCADPLGALRAGTAAQHRCGRHRAAEPRRSTGGFLVPHDQCREAIASASSGAGRQQRRTGRGAAGVPRGHPCRAGVVGPRAQVAGRGGAVVLWAGHQYPGMTRPLYDANPVTGNIWMPRRPPSTRTCLRTCSL